MKLNKYVAWAVSLAVSVCLFYAWHFYYKLGYVISDDPEDWGQLGDFIGGLVNPLLSFMTFIFVVKSLSSQNEANAEMKKEMQNTRKTERLRSFETQLFHMIGSQRTAFEMFKIDEVSCCGVLERVGVSAVLVLEDEVESLRTVYGEDCLELIPAYLEAVDPTDQIYGMTRIFYNMVKLISDKLSEANGFSLEDRESHYLTLINFTDFSLLRLVMLSAQFLDNPYTDYLKSAGELGKVLDEVGLSFELY